MTGPKDIAIAILVGCLVAFSIHAFVRKAQMGKLKAEIEVHEVNAVRWAEQIAKCEQNTKTLQTAIDEQNAEILDAEELGNQAQEAQDRADAYARRVILAEGRLQELLDAQERFDELAVGADTCQTYELVLRSIVGEVP